jgi:hypothetical protein
MKFTLGIIVVIGPWLDNRKGKSRNRKKTARFLERKINKLKGKGEF